MGRVICAKSSSLAVVTSTIRRRTSLVRARYDEFSANFRLLTYLDLGPPVPAGTLGDERSPFPAVTGNRLGLLPADIHRLAYKSSLSVSCHVFLGLPLLLFPPSGVHCTAALTCLAVGRRRT